MNTLPTAIEHMGVNHCCLYIFVSEQFLNGANIVAVWIQMSNMYNLPMVAEFALSV
jgi:hypothetical protein